VQAMFIAEVFGSAQVLKPTLCSSEVLRALHSVDYFPDFLSVFFFHRFCDYFACPLSLGSFNYSDIT
jgi:hypothetical protein